MWREKTALVALESFFRKDERFQIVKELPWFYAFSAYVVIAFLVTSLISIIVIWAFSPLSVFATLFLGAIFFAWVYFIGTRSLYGNYFAVTQYSVYRYIKKQIPQMDELPLNDVDSITVKKLWFAPRYASVCIRCRKDYLRRMPGLNRLYDLKNAQKNPEKADMRSLSLGKPVYLRLVCKNPREVYYIFADMKSIMGYSYRLYAKGRKNGKKKNLGR